MSSVGKACEEKYKKYVGKQSWHYNESSLRTLQGDLFEKGSWFSVKINIFFENFKIILSLMNFIKIFSLLDRNWKKLLFISLKKVVKHYIANNKIKV